MYIYTKNNLLIKPNTYMYTAFEGLNFLKEYRINRQDSISFLKKKIKSNSLLKNKSSSSSETYKALLCIQGYIEKGFNDLAFETMEPYLKRFEVAKRLRNSYPVADQSDLASLQVHVLFYNLTIQLIELFNDIRHVNLMLKIGDLLISIENTFESEGEIQEMILLLGNEIKIIDELIKKMGIDL